MLFAIKLTRGELSWQGWLSAVTIVIYITWGIAGCLAIIILGYLIFDRIDNSGIGWLTFVKLELSSFQLRYQFFTCGQEEPAMSAVEDVLFNDNSFYNDLEQLRLDIDAYVDVTSKRISSKRFAKTLKSNFNQNLSRSCFRKFHYTPITDTTYDLRLIKAMTLQLSRINTLVGNKQDDFIQAVMDRIADMELTELAGSQEIDVCELVTKLSQYLKVRTSKG